MWWKWVGGINQIFHAKCGSNRWRDCSLLSIAVYRDDQSICSFFKAEKVIYPAGSSTYRKMNKSWNLLYTHTMAIHRNSDAFWWHFIFQIFFCLFLLFLSFFSMQFTFSVGWRHVCCCNARVAYIDNSMIRDVFIPSYSLLPFYTHVFLLLIV